MSEPASIDDLVNKDAHSAASMQPHGEKKKDGNLESKVNGEHKEDNGWNFKKIAWDIIKYAPIGAAAFYLSGGAGLLNGTKTFWQASSSLISPFGLAIGKYLEDKKNKVKTKWSDIKKEMGTGNITGALAYWVYQAPEYFIAASGLDTTTVIGKIAKTAIFNPLMFFPFMALYQPMVYLRDKIGTKTALKGLVNGKIFSYLKEAYQNDMKKNYFKNIKRSSLPLFPSHYLTIGEGLVTDPAARVGIGGIHDIVFRLATGKKKENAEGEHPAKASIGQRMKGFYHSIPSKLNNFFKVPDYQAPYQSAVAAAH